jgi:hypothetical protein
MLWEHVLKDMGSLDAYKVSQSMEMEMYPLLYWLQRSFDLIPLVIFWLLCEEPDRKSSDLWNRSLWVLSSSFHIEKKQ